MGSYKESVGVDGVGGAGDECYLVFVGVVGEEFCVFGQDYVDGVYFVFEGFALDGDVDGVVFFDVFEVVKEGGVGKAAVASDYGVGAGAADGQRGAV